ncbi:MAG: LysR family transcriptional regulator [Terasakiella sp.]|uniref:LysR family transcriptional regulator n=1 Tax=unclassified Terasakiella TaxID=2614952 RepID=UPI003AFFA2CD
MEWKSITFDWNQMRAFLVAAQEGSFTAASKALGVTQPTVGRQVTALEEHLGITLFERMGRTLELTQTGVDLLQHVQAMGEAAAQISLTASGQSQSIEGRVCLSTTNVWAVYFLPDILTKIRHRYPGIELDIVASNALSDLKRREADIAIRHARPTQPDLYAQLLYETSGHLYVSDRYLEKFECPQSPNDLKEACLIGFDQSNRLLDYYHSMGCPVSQRNFPIRSENGLVAWEMVKQGLGVGIMVKEVAARTPGIHQILPDLPGVPIPVWLVTHRELKTNRRIRAVFECVAESFSTS